MKNLRILLVFPNGELMNPPPIAMGLFTALLRSNGFEVDLFDTTLYPESDRMGSDRAKEEILQARPFDYAERGVKLRETNMLTDIVKKLEDFNPDLIALSALECTYERSAEILGILENFNIPIIAGGVFATFAPENLLKHKNVKMVCIGEGEDVLVEVCKRIATGADYSDVRNLWVKKGNAIVKNGLREVIDINRLPIPDYSLFDLERFFRPMAGKVYRTIPIETNRGCPYSCAFCNSPSISKLYRDNKAGKFFRKKSLGKIQEELQYLIRKWDAEYVYFTSDTFLAVNDEEFDRFCGIYKEIGLPFWIQTRPETITEYRAEKLKEIGCHRMSIGLEHGNDKFRRRVLKKKFDNSRIIKASEIIAKAGIPLTINNIIGFPDETRELVFDTIELNRNLAFDTVNAVPFAPFHGTPLHELCVERKYISRDFTCGSLNVDAPLDMPQLSREEIVGLKRTFTLYARMPKEYWTKIKRAEKNDTEGNKIFSELRRIYQKNYF